MLVLSYDSYKTQKTTIMYMFYNIYRTIFYFLRR